MARTVILGASGTGKSYFGGGVLEHILADDDGSGRADGCACQHDNCDHQPGDDGHVPRVETGDGAPDFDTGEDFEYAIHYDVEDEETGFSNPEDPVLLTYEVDADALRRAVKVADDSPYIPDDVDTAEPMPLVQWVFYYNKYVRFVPDGLTDKEKKILAEMLADAAMEAGDCHFSVDEAHLIAEKHAIGDKLNRLITGGRKKGVEWLFITQRPQNLHEDILSQSDYTVYFRLTDRDRDKAASKSEAIEDAEGKIASLDAREAIIEDFEQHEWHQFNTNNFNRTIPHHAGDDGKADDAYESLFEMSSDGDTDSHDDGEDGGGAGDAAS
jgi:hypothetical protein